MDGYISSIRSVRALIKDLLIVSVVLVLNSAPVIE
jgi:hypothetical protein